MQKTDGFIANRMIWKAAKFKLPGQHSFLYKDMSTDMQQYLIEFIDVDVSGQPVLFFTKPTKEWTLLCTRQMIGKDGASVCRINIADIQAITPTVMESLRKGQVLNFRTEGSKTEWHQLTIINRLNNHYVLHTDKGNDLFGLLNILSMAISIAQ
jgi:hypothetical protein